MTLQSIYLRVDFYSFTLYRRIFNNQLCKNDFDYYMMFMCVMPRKVLTEPIKRLTVELPESEYNLLESYCLQKQESKRQVIRNLIRILSSIDENKNFIISKTDN